MVWSYSDSFVHIVTEGVGGFGCYLGLVRCKLLRFLDKKIFLDRVIHHAALRASTGTDENGALLYRFGNMEVDPQRT
jgi:hypothetical protein